MINFVTQQPYSGQNAETLVSSGFGSPFWMTFRQALSVGRVVRKGEQGTPLIRIVIKEVNENGKLVKKRVPKRFTVFNLEQTEEVSNEE